MNAAQRLVARAMEGSRATRRDGVEVREILTPRLGFRDVVVVERSQLNPLVGALRGLSLLQGQADPDLIRAWARGLDRLGMAEEWGGERQMGDVWQEVVDANRAGWQEKGYTISMMGQGHVKAVQVLSRGDTLHFLVDLTEWDLVKQMPLDVLAWGVVAKALANCLKVEEMRLIFSPGVAYIDLADIREAEGMIRPRERTRVLNLTYMWTVAGYVELIQDVKERMRGEDMSEWLAVIHSATYLEMREGS